MAKKSSCADNSIKIENVGFSLARPYLGNNQVAIIQRRSLELHQDFIFADFRNSSVLVNQAVKVVFLIFNDPLLHSGGRHFTV